MSHFLQISGTSVGEVSAGGSEPWPQEAAHQGLRFLHEETRTFLGAGDRGRDVKPGSREIMQLSNITKFLETESFRVRRR